jgi:prepilin-type N-terminal cleavage/methylation domain-containing protein
MVRRARSRRGLTLIELLVSSVVGLIMLSAALALLVQGVSLQQKQRKISEMKRSAALVLGQLGSELRQAGLGIPRGVRVGTGTGLGDRFPASIMLAEDHRIGFLADLSRPDSSFNGYSQLAGDQTPGTLPDERGLALLNEFNGGCDVVNGSANCKSDLASHLFDYSVTTTDTNCASRPDRARTCPWSLKRYRGSEYIIVADALGRWVERQVDGGIYGVHTGSKRVTLSLNVKVPPELVSGGPNQGYASTPDRVFYRINNGWVERNQCWGSVSAPIATLSQPCTGTTNGTDWERLARGALTAQPTFTYYTAGGAQLPTPVAAASLRSIHRVDITLRFERVVGTGADTKTDAATGAKKIEHEARSSITLRQ